MSMRNQYSKRIRKQLRELASLAYERELGEELSALAEHFDDWRSGNLSGRELSDLIHTFHQGPSRKIWSRYHTRALDADILVVQAVAGDLTNARGPS